MDDQSDMCSKLRGLQASFSFQDYDIANKDLSHTVSRLHQAFGYILISEDLKLRELLGFKNMAGCSINFNHT